MSNLWNPPPRRATGAVRRPAVGMQAKHKDQDAEPYATRYSCSTHSITYYVPAATPQQCPMCTMEQQVTRMRRDLVEAENEVTRLKNQLGRAQVQLEVLSAIREALQITNTEDLVWLKTQLYQYKIDKSVVLKVTHGHPSGSKKRARKGQKLPANGFIAMPRHGEPEGYACTSLGGLAIADYFDEACTTVGSAQAMGLLLKALWKELPGAAR